MTRGEKLPIDPLLEALFGAARSEEVAVAFLEERRWKCRPTCPRCAADSGYMMVGRDGLRNRDSRWRCRECKRMYTVRTGTIMEGSRLPLRVWVHAFWRASASKKGVSALQISRECSLNYKSALFLLHRIREAMGVENGGPGKLHGKVEADECYVGGKPRRGSGIHHKRGRGTSKRPVFGVVEREEKAQLKVLPGVTSKNIKSTLLEHTEQSARLITEECSR